MWEYITGAIATPLESLRAVAQKRLWKEGLLLVLLVGLIKGAAGVITSRSAPSPLSGLSPADFPFLETLRRILESPSFLLGNALFSGLLFWLLVGTISFGLARLFRGEGTLGGLLAGFGFAASPNLIGVPLTALVSLLGNPGMVLSSLIGLATGVWVLVLQVLSIRESTGVSSGAALGTILLALLAFFLILIFLGVVISLVAFLLGGLPM